MFFLKTATLDSPRPQPPCALEDVYSLNNYFKYIVNDRRTHHQYSEGTTPKQHWGG